MASLVKSIFTRSEISPYNILGVSENCGEEEIKQIFNQKASQALDQGDEKTFTLLSNAFHILGDQRRRKYYDSNSIFISDYLCYKDAIIKFKEIFNQPNDFSANFRCNDNLNTSELYFPNINQQTRFEKSGSCSLLNKFNPFQPQQNKEMDINLPKDLDKSYVDGDGYKVHLTIKYSKGPYDSIIKSVTETKEKGGIKKYSQRREIVSKNKLD